MLRPHDGGQARVLHAVGAGWFDHERLRHLQAIILVHRIDVIEILRLGFGLEDEEGLDRREGTDALRIAHVIAERVVDPSVQDRRRVEWGTSVYVRVYPGGCRNI